MASRVQIYTDPLQHALIAAARRRAAGARGGRRVFATAVGAALAIDVDHAVAARSVRVRDTTALATRPRTHSLLAALARGRGGRRAAGPLHGWATFGGARLAPPPRRGRPRRAHAAAVAVRPARQLGRRRQLAGTAALVLASLAISRATARSSRPFFFWR